MVLVTAPVPKEWPLVSATALESRSEAPEGVRLQELPSGRVIRISEFSLASLFAMGGLCLLDIALSTGDVVKLWNSFPQPAGWLLGITYAAVHYVLLRQLFNTTEVRLWADRLEIVHGPVPPLRHQVVARKDISNVQIVDMVINVRKAGPQTFYRMFYLDAQGEPHGLEIPQDNKVENWQFLQGRIRDWLSWQS